MGGIQPNVAIEVHPVKNGFLVMKSGNHKPIEEWMVFESFDELLAWLAQHFTDRNSGVTSDEYNRS